MKSSWFFDIHEDTPDQEMTNLLQHSTCILDISSDEESARRARDDRGKENVPPADDASQTSSRRARRGAAPGPDEMVIEAERAALKDLDVGEFYADGCDASSVFVVPADEEEEVVSEKAEAETKAEGVVGGAEAEAEVVVSKVEAEEEVVTEPEALLERNEPALPAAVLEPMEGTGESFELWESGSSKGEEAPLPAPLAA